MPYVQVIANKIGVTQSVNGSWIQAIAEATFSGGGTGSTPGGITQSVQYNDGSDGFTGDANFTREYTGGINDSFFNTSTVGSQSMIIGNGDWTPLSFPIISSGIQYTNGDFFSGLFAGDISGIGGGTGGTGGIGLAIINQDDASGDTSFITSTYEGTGITLQTASASNFFNLDGTVIEAKYDNSNDIAGWTLDTEGVVLKSENVGASASTELIVNPTTIKTIGLPAYDDDTAAGVGGLTTGDMYQTTGSGSSPLNAACIMMIKQ